MTTSPPLSHPDGESYDDLHERVLRFMGAFASMQFGVDSALEIFLRKRVPHLGPVLVKEFLGRKRDSQRLPCFLALAKEIGYAHSLPTIKRIYDRAVQTRDLIGHSLHVVGPVLHPGGLRTVGVTRLRTTKQNLVPDPLTPSSFDRLKNDCEWIGTHATRVLYEANVTHFMTFTGEPFEPPIPPATPVEGEPL